jgi:hypothetical protein
MRIICPACGVTSLVDSEEGSGVVKCTACGKRIRWGVQSVEEVPAGNVDDDIGFAPPVESVGNPIMKPVRAKPGNRTPLIMGLVGVVVVAVVAGLVVVAEKAMTPAVVETPATAPAPLATPAIVPWDRLHRAELLAMKDNADALAITGNPQQAYDAYKQILAAVADHDVSDPVVVQVVAGVRLGQDRVLAMLMTPKAQATTGPTALAAVPIRTAATTQASSAPVAMTNAVKPHIAPLPATEPVIQLDPAQLAADSAPVMGGPPPPAPSLHAYTLPDTVTDAQIGDAITNGVNFLKGQFRNGEITTVAAGKGGNNPGPPGRGRRIKSNLDDGNPGDLPPAQKPLGPGPAFVAPWESAYNVPGVDALCVYSLLHAGQAMDQKILGEQDPFTDEILSVLKRYDMVFTYHRSLRAAALAVFNRTQDNAALEEDIRWLLAAGPQGAYSYTLPAEASGGPWDNSNSQYGLLGVWSGAMVGKAVPQTYWKNVEQHWEQCAYADGTFPYSLGAAATTTMTCAGVASLLVAHDYMDSPDIVGKAGNRASAIPALDNGLTWLDTGDNCMTFTANIGGDGYALYGLERVGLASGFKYFGMHDWYGELAKQLVAKQHFDGSWGANPTVNGVVNKQTLVDTAYALLFLARGRHPILYNKLRYAGPWNNRPHDVSHLARFAAHELERPLNWQVVNLRRNWFDWMDSPVLYISGDKRPNFSAKDYAALRDFAYGGGLIFTHADGGSAEFNHWVSDAVRIMFPKYELMQVPRNDAIYSTVYPIKMPPPLLSVSNGSRTLLISSPTDISGGWQLNWPEDKKTAFQLGVNLFVYAAGKGNLKNRLVSSYIPADPDRPDTTRQIARLQYPSEWDPEPYAWTRFSRFFQWETHQAIDPITVQLKDLKPGSVPMAVLTGTVRHDFTKAEQQAAQAYVSAGGVLMIDACGGQEAFVHSVQNTLLPQAFEGVSPLPIGPNHPLIRASRPHASDLSHMLLRGYASEHGGKNFPLLSIAYGKGWVVFSRLDLTTGLLGTQTWGIRGYDPAYAEALMMNAVLWAEARSPVQASTAPATLP